MSKKKMGLLSKLKRIIPEGRAVCAFCDERKNGDDVYVSAGRLCICRKCFGGLDKTALAMPFKGTKSVSYIMSPFRYTDRLRRAILDYKFNGKWAYGELFASMMRDYLDSYGVWDEFDCIVPVPLHEERLRERGYNQSEIAAKYVAEYIGTEMRTDIVFRIRATKRQSTLKNIERVLNVKGAFGCGYDLSGKKILLFDDICTTGSTLEACADALTDAGAQTVCALTIAISFAEKNPYYVY